MYYSYFDEKENISFFTNNRECPINYNKLIEEKNICISNCFKDVKYKYEFRNKCYSECPPDSNKEEIMMKMKVIFVNQYAMKIFLSK